MSSLLGGQKTRRLSGWRYALPMIIAICGQKGGAGKTTLAINLAAEFHRQGRRVLLVDCDPQGSTLTWGQVAVEMGHPSPAVVAMGPGLHRQDQLPAMAAGFQHTVIDCPPRLGEVQRAALMVADLALLPCGPGAVDAWAVVESIDQVKAAQDLRPTLGAAVVITRKAARAAISSGAREVLAAGGLPILATELGFRVAYQEAPAAGQGVTSYAPSSAAAREVRALAKEVLKWRQ